LARGPRYRVPFRRRREMKTDYKLRKALIASRIPRLVVRCTNSHTVVQVVEAKLAGDITLSSASSKELQADFGWRGDCGNLPAAYLTGLVAGFRALSRGVKKAVLDIGLQRSTGGGRIFAALKGVIDSKLGVPYGGKVLPAEPRLRGEHIASYAKKLSSDAELYKRCFSQYLHRKLKPEDLPSHFDEVKSRVHQKLSGGGKAE